MPLRAALVVLVALTSSCSSTSNKKGGGQAKDDLDLETKDSTPKARAIDPCAPSQLGLGAARQLKPWAAPTGCTAKSGATAPTAIESDADFTEHFTCPEGTKSGIDFAKEQLVVQDRSLSPAGAGTTIVDDGTRVTFIERQRSPCPDDPQPMPMNFTLGFLLPAGAERAYDNRACTLPPQCGK